MFQLARSSIFSSVVLGVSLVLAAGACRGSDNNDDNNDDVVRVDGRLGDDVSITEIQDPAGGIGIDQAVTLRGVVVLAIDTYGARKGNIFVGEPEGGAYSGVLVFGAPLGDIDSLAVGDLVDIEGAVKTEFALTDDTSGRTTTELQPAQGGVLSVTKVGTGTLPAPHVVDAAALVGKPQAEVDAEWEKWEGVLIQVDDLTITGGIRQINVESDPLFIEFVLEGDLHVDSSLAEIPNPVQVGTCVKKAVGIGDYFFSWKILPTSLSGVDISGTDCAGIASVTIEDLQTGMVPNNTGVTLENVIVTAVSNNKSNIWVQSALASSPSNGIFVFRGNSSVPDVDAQIVVGATVNVSGTFNPYTYVDAVGDMEFSQIRNPLVTFVSAPTTPPVPVAGVTLATLNDPVLGEPYEGVLVTLTNVKVTNVVVGDFMTIFPEVTISQGGATLKVESTIFNQTAVVGDCFASMTGIFGTNTFSPVHLNFLPRSAADSVLGGTCP